jgi:ubiquinone/menaquinone biosynthesis C-methylase UbiE
VRIAAAAYRRINPASTVGLTWKRQGPHVTFEWDGFVAAPSIPMLFARHRYEMAVIEEVLTDKVSENCLEYGCGFGRLSPIFARHARRHTAIDINPSAVQAAAVAYPDLRFDTYDGHRLPFEAATFDLVVTWTVVQHIPPSRIDEALADILRVLQPGGRILLCEETRLVGQRSRHAWHRAPDFYEERFVPLRLTYSRYIDEIDRLPGLTSPGRVMFFEP